MRRFLLPVLLIIALAVAGLWWFTRPLPILTVVTWSGAYGRAQANAMMRPYGSAKRVDVRPANYDGDLGGLARAVKTGVYDGDVIDLELPNAIAACEQGLLEKIDAATLPAGADGTPAAKDFVAGALGPCWVGSVVYAQVLIYAPATATRHFAAPPTRLADFFDTTHFPGGRALHAGAKYNLELALLADGVAPADVYRTLETPAGVTRALAKLSNIRGVLRLWNNGGEAIGLVKSGQVAFAAALNGDVFDAGQHGFAPGVVWDRQLYELDVFGVPKGDPKKEMALDFVRYATGAKPLADMAGWMPFGPARRSSMPLVGANPETHVAMAAQLPTSHFDTAFAIDDAWWRTHAAAIAPRWQAWLDSGLDTAH